ncbi:MAG: Cell wall invasion-associated protein [Candidatus Tokpelaia hoelldobleri]|uniref:Cell wall invasion-associated protein n=1 Tax=Candidatus Tokpelaia hoelldobleri TaxID=1902579 RepID=A0A1U9JVN4_9HYPH|nr:MAG: Cell wall invasion-associated protein [Candidatus Tokpelaia hoelldoblerii]
MTQQLDARLNAFRPDLADSRLARQVKAKTFVEGVKQRIAEPVVDMRGEPRSDSAIATQLLRGQDVLVFERREGFAWVQALDDGYVGYIRDIALESADVALTHHVIAPRTFVYPAADLRFPPVAALSLGSRVAIAGQAQTRGTDYALLENGNAVIRAHITEIRQQADDYASVAESLLHTPYLWGGASAFGIDCSGLVQLSMRMAGKAVLRDSDMQAATIGKQLKANGKLRRGDLVFWRGHVAIMADSENIIHANGASMDVRLEPLHEAVARIGGLYGQPTVMRRP